MVAKSKLAVKIAQCLSAQMIRVVRQGHQPHGCLAHAFCNIYTPPKHNTAHARLARKNKIDPHARRLNLVDGIGFNFVNSTARRKHNQIVLQRIVQKIGPIADSRLEPAIVASPDDPGRMQLRVAKNLVDNQHFRNAMTNDMQPRPQHV